MQNLRSFRRSPWRQKHTGQGVVEYAGALVIASAIISIGLVVVPSGFSGMVSTIITTTLNYLVGQVP